MINKAMQKFYKEVGNMALNEGDKAICSQIAERIIKEVMQQHVKTCPHVIKWKLVAAVFFGAILGSGLVNGLGSTLAKFIISP